MNETVDLYIYGGNGDIQGSYKSGILIVKKGKEIYKNCFAVRNIMNANHVKGEVHALLHGLSWCLRTHNNSIRLHCLAKSVITDLIVGKAGFMNSEPENFINTIRDKIDKKEIKINILEENLYLPDIFMDELISSTESENWSYR